jgi:DnaJ-class molecular chaperone
MEKDYYKILNIQPGATKDEIKKAYYKLSLLYHPDKNKNPDAEEKFKEISDAYDKLTSSNKPNQQILLNPFNFNGFNNFNMNMNMNINMANISSTMKSTQIFFKDGKKIIIEKTVTTSPDGISHTEVKEYIE